MGAQKVSEKYPFQWLDIMRNEVNATEELKGCKPQQLPLEESVKAFNEYMMQEMKDFDGDAKNLPRHKRITYSRVMAFNYRRGPEVRNLILGHWKRCLEDVWKNSTEIQQLSKMEKKLAMENKIVYIKDKKKRMSDTFACAGNALQTAMCDNVVPVGLIHKGYLRKPHKGAHV